MPMEPGGPTTTLSCASHKPHHCIETQRPRKKQAHTVLVKFQKGKNSTVIGQDEPPGAPEGPERGTKGDRF
eukprot:2703196-Pyramimonas_sp.AAC.1